MTKTGLIAAVIISALWAIGGSPAFAAIGDTCTSSAACSEGYCAKEVGDCAGPGVCRGLNPNLMCANVYEPVCGCDGKTYGNICEAERVGVNIQHPGRCIIVGTCGDNSQCPSGYCSTIPGSCDAIGTCAPRPIGCTDSYNPVCGCDGTTYPNECMAATAGISVAFQGACPSLPTACHTNNDCPNQTCSKNPGDCGGTGVCVTPPPVCTNLYEPVCGCDGKTYPNNCEALRAGITIVSLGMCKPACVPTSTREKGKACKDRIDNDCDGLIDRLDVDCK